LGDGEDTGSGSLCGFGGSSVCMAIGYHVATLKKL